MWISTEWSKQIKTYYTFPLNDISGLPVYLGVIDSASTYIFFTNSGKNCLNSLRRPIDITENNGTLSLLCAVKIYDESNFVIRIFLTVKLLSVVSFLLKLLPKWHHQIGPVLDYGYGKLTKDSLVVVNEEMITFDQAIDPSNDLSYPDHRWLLRRKRNSQVTC